MEAESKAVPCESIINVAEAVASSIEMDPLWSHGFRESPKSCIFTVSKSLSRHNEVAYKPRTFSIGPLHYSEEHLKDAQNIKFRYLSNLVSRVKVQVKDLTTAVAELETNARDHYGEQINLSSAEFVKIMVLDGCFIIEFLLKLLDFNVGIECNDALFNRSSIFVDLIQDLMLLENQIPWIVLDALFTMTSSNEELRNPESSLPHLAIKFVEGMLSSSFGIFLKEEDRALNLDSVKGQHILEFARHLLIHNISDFQKTETGTAWQSIPTATELENAGITLKKNESNALTIRFEDGILEMSPLILSDATEGLFRNIIALEQCSRKYPTIFTAYAFILDDLIKTTEDINCLSSKEIINSKINPDDALCFFNKLCNEVTIHEYCYPSLATHVNAYRRRRWPQWRAVLIRNYFSNPWIIVSTFAAFVLLVLTFLQTVYTMKG